MPDNDEITREKKLAAHRLAVDLRDPKRREQDEELEARWKMMKGEFVDKDSLHLVPR